MVDSTIREVSVSFIEISTHNPIEQLSIRGFPKLRPNTFGQISKKYLTLTNNFGGNWTEVLGLQVSCLTRAFSVGCASNDQQFQCW